MSDKSRREAAASAYALLRSVPPHAHLAQLLHCVSLSSSSSASGALVVVHERGSASLAEGVLACRAWTEHVVAACGRQLVLALSALHSAGIVFGSLSPAAVFLVAPVLALDVPQASVKLTFHDSVRAVSTKASSSPVFSGPFAAPDNVASTACDM